jgi:hypothetical protein
MNHEEKVKAIQQIRPNAEFVLDGLELKWLDSKQTKPTDNEIETGWAEYQTRLANEAAEIEAKKISAQEKLAALGLTLDDLKALGLA